VLTKLSKMTHIYWE